MKPKHARLDDDMRRICAELEQAKANYRPRCKPWRDDEVELLRRFYGKVPIHLLASKLGRTTTGVKSKAKSLSWLIVSPAVAARPGRSEV